MSGGLTDASDPAASAEMEATRRSAGDAPPSSKGGDTRPDTAGGMAAPLGDYSRYRIDGEIGRGGMGVVYRVWDLDLERAVAMKVVREGAVDDPAFAARFVEEARGPGAHSTAIGFHWNGA